MNVKTAASVRNEPEGDEHLAEFARDADSKVAEIIESGADPILVHQSNIYKMRLMATMVDKGRNKKFLDALRPWEKYEWKRIPVPTDVEGAENIKIRKSYWGRPCAET